MMFWLLKGFVSCPSFGIKGTMTRIDLKQKVQNDESHSDSFLVLNHLRSFFWGELGFIVSPLPDIG